MNELEFKHHLKDLVHGHHHPEEHDWTQPTATKRISTAQAPKAKRKAVRKSSKAK